MVAEILTDQTGSHVTHVHVIQRLAGRLTLQGAARKHVRVPAARESIYSSTTIPCGTIRGRF